MKCIIDFSRKSLRSSDNKEFFSSIITNHNRTIVDSKVLMNFYWGSLILANFTTMVNFCYFDTFYNLDHAVWNLNLA